MSTVSPSHPPAGPSLLTEPGPAPRAVTVRGRRRSWGEPAVRVWWLTGLALAVIGGSLTAARVMGSAEDRRLIRVGRGVEARVVEAAGMKIPGQVVGPEAQATFVFDVTLDGKSHRIEGKLKQQRELLGPGRTVTLLVDPADPTRYTDRLEANWVDDLLVASLLLPPVAVLLAVALVRRAQVLRAWREGEPMTAVVVETRQAAAAPLSRIVRYTLKDARDKRVYSTVVPNRVGGLGPGEEFRVVARAEHPGRAVVAALYV